MEIVGLAIVSVSILLISLQWEIILNGWYLMTERPDLRRAILNPEPYAINSRRRRYIQTIPQTVIPMIKNLTLLSVLIIISSSCSEKTQSDRPQVPWSGEWYPVNYTIMSDKAIHAINECSNNIGSFSAELDIFLSGNLLIGDIDHSDPNSTGFKGPFTWASRCNATDRYEGTWDTQDYGATVALKPTNIPDSTLQFNATSSAAGLWKLTYAIGADAVTIHYKLKRN